MQQIGMLGSEKTGAMRHPVIEAFGPTIQGEGPLIGAACYFVRFGGCDYRCSWCDSKYAVKPEEIQANKEMLTADEIGARLEELPGTARWVILSGGNPALQHLGPLLKRLHGAGFLAQVETQGTLFRPWLKHADRVVVSPKPPSSGMETNWGMLTDFLSRLERGRTALKVVVFDEADFAFARDVHARYPSVEFSLSVGNDYGKDSVEDLLEKYRWLCDLALADPKMGRARVLPQMHVLVWGNQRGV